MMMRNDQDAPLMIVICNKWHLFESSESINNHHVLKFLQSMLPPSLDWALLSVRSQLYSSVMKKMSQSRVTLNLKFNRQVVKRNATEIREHDWICSFYTWINPQWFRLSPNGFYLISYTIHDLPHDPYPQHDHQAEGSNSSMKSDAQPQSSSSSSGFEPWRGRMTWSLPLFIGANQAMILRMYTFQVVKAHHQMSSAEMEVLYSIKSDDLHFHHLMGRDVSLNPYADLLWLWLVT